MASATCTKTSAGKRSQSVQTTRSAKRSESTTDLLSNATNAPVLATTFGIELEFVFAFRENLLRSIISKYDLKADIIKTLTEVEHKSLIAAERIARGSPVPAYEGRQRMPSWALHVPESDVVCNSDQNLHKGMVCSKFADGKRWLRRYVMEPLLIAKTLLNREGVESNVVGWIETHPHQRSDPDAAIIKFPTADSVDGSVMLREALVDYSKWTLTNDYTIIGALRSQLQSHLEGRGVVREEMATWDSYGMEMISPVFQLEKKDEAFAEVGRYLEALMGEDTSLFGSVWTSVHVHIGFNFEKSEDMPMLLLQHLAYILVLHEDLISKCHPRSRSGIAVTDAAVEEFESEDFDEEFEFDPDAEFPPLPAATKSALENEEEERVLAAEAKYTGVYPGGENVNSNARYLRQRLLKQSPAYQTLTCEDAIFKSDGTIFDLVGLLQRTDDSGTVSRGYMYNFANLVNLARNKTSWKPIKPTVEFRQHACTLDPAVLKRWVTFLEAIVRKAQEKASETSAQSRLEETFAEQEASKYTHKPWPYQDMRQFCVDFLGLDDDAGDYWQGRFDTYKDDRPEDGRATDT